MIRMEDVLVEDASEAKVDIDAVSAAVPRSINLLFFGSPSKHLLTTGLPKKSPIVQKKKKQGGERTHVETIIAR